MPRKKNKTPSYLRHPCGQARVRINGDDILLGEYQSPESYEKYAKVIAEYKATGAVASFLEERGTISITELVDRYWQFCLQKFGNRKKRNGDIRLSRIKTTLGRLTKLYGQDLVDSFGPLKLTVLRQEFIKAGWTRKYINVCVEEVIRAFRWGAGTREIVLGETVHKLNCFPKLEKYESDAPESRKILPVEESLLARTVVHLNPIVRAMVELQLWTGMRPGELCNLKPAHICCEPEVTIPGIGKLQLNGLWLYQPPEHKTEEHGITRCILIGPHGQEILKPYLERDPNKYCFVPEEAYRLWIQFKRSNRKTKVQPSQILRSELAKEREMAQPWGECYDTNSYRTSIRYACDKEDRIARKINGDKRKKVPREERLVSWWHPHQLRHNAGTRIASEFGEEVARIVLGHTTMKETRRYVVDDLRKAAEAIRKAG